MKLKIVIKGIVFVFVATFFLHGCYPDEDIYYSDTDVAITRNDPDFIFKDKMICVLFDTIMHVVERDEEPEKGPYDDFIIQEIKRNLEDNTMFEVYVVKDSMELINEGVSPSDVNLVITSTAMQTDYYSYYYPWYGWWYWGWGWSKKSGSLKSTEQTTYYYPWYPWNPGYYYSYSSGTLLLDMVNVGGVDKKELVLPVVWNGSLSGVLSGNEPDQKARLTKQIDQLFIQSTYLR